MAGIAVLRPQDPFRDRLACNRHNSFVNSSFPSAKSKKGSSSSNPSHGSERSNRRKRSPQKNSNSSRGGGASLSSSPPAKNRHLVMGQVKILKRGEALTVSSMKEKSEVNSCATESLNDDDLALSTTDRLGPEPDMVPKHIRIADFYAGSVTFVSSPPPSSLPLPAFFKKKSVLAESHDDASSGLRRLLRLEPLWVCTDPKGVYTLSWWFDWKAETSGLWVEILLSMVGWLLQFAVASLIFSRGRSGWRSNSSSLSLIYGSFLP